MLTGDHLCGFFEKDAIASCSTRRWRPSSSSPPPSSPPRAWLIYGRFLAEGEYPAFLFFTLRPQSHPSLVELWIHFIKVNIDMTMRERAFEAIEEGKVKDSPHSGSLPSPLLLLPSQPWPPSPPREVSHPYHHQVEVDLRVSLLREGG